MAYVGRPALLWRSQLSRLVKSARAGRQAPCTAWNTRRHYSKKTHKGKIIAAW